MNITVIGKGRVGGGLAKRWRAAGHEVQEIGRDGGDAASADVLLVAVPAGKIAEALGKVSGIDGKVAIDATNAPFGGRDEAYASLAHQVQAIVGGPVSKAFNLNFAPLYDVIDEQPERPANLYVSDDAARAVTEQLTRDAGYEPVNAGGLDKARMLEDHLALMFAVNQAGLGAYFYRMWSPS